MADLKSSVGVICYCSECDRNVALELTSKPNNGRICTRCGNSMQIKEQIEMRLSEENKRSVGELTVDIDVSNALKGLKAVQCEARKTIKLLKEVEHLQEVYINDDSTNQ